MKPEHVKLRNKIAATYYVANLKHLQSEFHDPFRESVNVANNFIAELERHEAEEQKVSGSAGGSATHPNSLLKEK